MTPITYGSVCSGIEAVSVAWHCLGWRPGWFAKIEKLPSAVLAYRWPDITNPRDMTKFAAAIRTGKIEVPIYWWWAPCQAFSVAGLRNGLADERGELIPLIQSCNLNRPFGDVFADLDAEERKCIRTRISNKIPLPDWTCTIQGSQSGYAAFSQYAHILPPPQQY